MSILSDRLNEAMAKRRMKQVDLVEKTGIGKSSISTYLTGAYAPKQANLYKLARALAVNPAWLMGEDAPMEEPDAAPPLPGNLLPVSRLDLRQVPLVGEAAKPVERPVPDDHAFDAVLRVSDDAMEPRYREGDLALIRYQTDVDDGQVAAVWRDGEVTLKRVYHAPGGLQLISMGIIGQYVGKTYLEAKRRPRYIISERTWEKPGGVGREGPEEKN